MDGEIVSYFVLHEREGVTPYSSNDDSIFFRSFSTNVIHQRKGYAKKVFKDLPTYLMENFPHIKMIYLGVTLSNTGAITLYKKVGFVDTGIREIRKKRELTGYEMGSFLDYLFKTSDCLLRLSDVFCIKKFQRLKTNL